MKFKQYLNEGKKLDPFVMGYPETEFLNDGEKILEDIKSHIQKNYVIDKVGKVQMPLNDPQRGLEQVYVYEKKEFWITWGKYDSSTYKGKKLTYNVWSAGIKNKYSSGGYQIGNTDNLDKQLKSFGVMKK